MACCLTLCGGVVSTWSDLITLALCVVTVQQVKGKDCGEGIGVIVDVMFPEVCPCFIEITWLQPKQETQRRWKLAVCIRGRLESWWHTLTCLVVNTKGGAINRTALLLNFPGDKCFFFCLFVKKKINYFQKCSWTCINNIFSMLILFHINLCVRSLTKHNNDIECYQIVKFVTQQHL